jgi:hypothetical protein
MRCDQNLICRVKKLNYESLKKQNYFKIFVGLAPANSDTLLAVRPLSKGIDKLVWQFLGQPPPGLPPSCPVTARGQPALTSL